MLYTHRRISIAILIAVFFVTSACEPSPERTPTLAVEAEPSPLASPTVAATSPAFLQALPQRYQLPGRSPEERASALAAELDKTGTERLSAWLAAYDALGIPIIDDDGRPLGTTGDDPIGPPYWRVAYASALSEPGRGIRLDDFVLLFSGGNIETFDKMSAAGALLADLRSALESSDPQVQLFGWLVLEIVRQAPSTVDLRDTAISADQVWIRTDLAEMLAWVVIRNLVFSDAVLMQPTSHAPAVPPTFGAGIGAFANWVMPRNKKPAGLDASNAWKPLETSCSELVVNEDVTFWLNWIVGKLGGGGVQLPGMLKATRGLVEQIQEYRGVSENVIERTKKITGIVSALTAALSLYMQVNALMLDSVINPDPLVRTRSAASDGNSADIDFRLSSDPGKLPNMDNMLACLSSFLMNAFGIGLSFPTADRLAGVELLFYGGKGFSEYVLFYDSRQMQRVTDSNGEARISVTGKAQKRQIPNQAMALSREFSLHVSGQTEPVDGNTIFNVFFEGLSFGAAPSASGAISAALEILKTIHWDLGEYVYRLKDWWAPQALEVKVTQSMNFNLGGAGNESLVRSGEARIPLQITGPNSFSGSGILQISESGSIEGTSAGFSCAFVGGSPVPVTIEGRLDEATGRVDMDISVTGEAQGLVECQVPGYGTLQQAYSTGWNQPPMKIVFDSLPQTGDQQESHGDVPGVGAYVWTFTFIEE